MSAKARPHKEWEEWSQADPFYAICYDPTKKRGGWEAQQDEFFRSGDAAVRGLLETAGELGVPKSWRRVLDFGCGLGRVSQALAQHSGQVVGVDVSPTMVARARTLH